MVESGGFFDRDVKAERFELTDVTADRAFACRRSK